MMRPNRPSLNPWLGPRRDYLTRNRHREGHYRERIAARNAAGLCGWCANPPKPGRQRCATCSAIERIKARARRHALKEAA